MRTEDFESYHKSIYGKPPFPWQSRLLRQIIAERKWPSMLDLPTGAGKTSCIDIALFALALDAEVPISERWCPRRIAMVVDRKVIVDQAAERGRMILRALTATEAPRILREVADRLRSLSKEAKDPIRVFTLRGGIPKDDGWARTPDQPLVLASTVDQIGSRLLIQGYGVSPSMRPVHTGLLANDLLLFLDEVHLSGPFADTLNALETLRRPFIQSSGLTSRFIHVFLSATPGEAPPSVFRLNAEDVAPESILGQRLHVSKRAEWREVNDRATLEQTCVQEALTLLHKHDVVAVVLNRVDSAAAVAREIERTAAAAADVVLLTGRMRPLDRDDILQDLRPRVMAGRNRSQVGRKLVLVATQCIEAGADFDFDALITEVASLDALRQRFGRLDRLGEYRKSEAVILFDKSQKEEDPIYGKALSRTGRWIREKLDRTRHLDFGVLRLPTPQKEELRELLPPRKQAPILMPAYMDLWIQTTPPPARVPEVALWLHGSESAPPYVQVVWRNDLTEEDLLEADVDRLVEIVGAIRPSSLEAASVPFSVVRDWLKRKQGEATGDVEGGMQRSENGTLEGPSALAFRWAGDESEVITADKLLPGDTIVVPSTRGGLSRGSFDPQATQPVADLAERAALMGRGIPMLRLHPAVLHQLGISALEDLEETLKDLAEKSPPGWRRLWLERVASGRLVTTVRGPEPWGVLQGRRVSAPRLREAINDLETFEDGADLQVDDEESYHTGRPVPLQAHSAHVETFARAYAENVGLPSSLTQDLALAGWLHDVGKADRRFQVLLRGGSEIEFLKDETPWAKSGMCPGAKAAHRLAQVRSGYPRGARHEVQSLAMLEKRIDLLRTKANDVNLVLYLVSSHHGWCRPFAPAVEDPQPVEVALKDHQSNVFGRIDFEPTTSANRLEQLNSSLGDRFWGLVRKYGWWGLCWLESILRLADHRASEEEQAAGASQ